MNAAQNMVHSIDVLLLVRMANYLSSNFRDSAGPPTWVYEPICSLGFSQGLIQKFIHNPGLREGFSGFCLHFKPSNSGDDKNNWNGPTFGGVYCNHLGFTAQGLLPVLNLESPSF